MKPFFQDEVKESLSEPPQHFIACYSTVVIVPASATSRKLQEEVKEDLPEEEEVRASANGARAAVGFLCIGKCARVLRAKEVQGPVVTEEANACGVCTYVCTCMSLVCAATDARCSTDAAFQDLKDQDVWDLNRARELWKLGQTRQCEDM